MTAVKQTVMVTIRGQEYSIRTDADAVHVHRVARLVDERLAELDRRTRTVNTLNLLVLALMNVTGDYLQVSSELDETRARIERLIGMLPAEVAGSG
ncbi:MAG: cell division protein ZapA [Deltaproteobacteria bacterium]|nr:cell division protein ZapA [Candidatus Anaeroferrophillacea bacterium]